MPRLTIDSHLSISLICTTDDSPVNRSLSVVHTLRCISSFCSGGLLVFVSVEKVNFYRDGWNCKQHTTNVVLLSTRLGTGLGELSERKRLVPVC